MSITLTKTWEVDGVLTDPTSVKLSDATGTYGVKRNDTDAVVVADGTSMTKTSTGVYSYTFSEPATSLTYTAFIEVVYEGLTHYFEVDVTGSTPAPLTLAVTYSDLQLELAHYIGWGRTSASWSAAQLADLDDYIQSGLRQFYWPAVQEGLPPVRWSFLQPGTTLATVNATHTYSLPGDFSGAMGGVTYGVAVVKPPLVFISDSHLRALQAQNNKAGSPTHYSIIPVSCEGASAQQWQISLYPTPDAVYTLYYDYEVAPAALSSSNQYPYGGANHGETILESCLAIAEERVGDKSGIHRARFASLLAASIERDSKISADEPGENWPVGYTAATGLDVTYIDLQRHVGHELGYGYDPARWTNDQTGIADDVIRRGMRQFLTPPPLPKETYGHEWSFLTPVTYLSTVASTSTVVLPDDFSSMEGPLTYETGEGAYYSPIELVAEDYVRQRLSWNDSTSRPIMAAIRPKALSATACSKYELIFYPTPDAVYKLYYKYRKNINALTTTNLYPPGTAMHGETILESCLAIAEQVRDSKPGLHTERFHELLFASVSADRKASCPNTLGYNGDNSDRPVLPYPYDTHDCGSSLVSYNGVYY